MPSIYLGGAFAQFTAAEVRARQAAIEQGLKPHITCLKPQHSGDYAASLGPHLAATLTTRDYLQIKQSDILVLDMLEATKISAGSMIEIGWAWEMKKPVLLLAEPTNPNHHAMAINLVRWIVPSRPAAVEIINTALS